MSAPLDLEGYVREVLQYGRWSGVYVEAKKLDVTNYGDREPRFVATGELVIQIIVSVPTDAVPSELIGGAL